LSMRPERCETVEIHACLSHGSTQPASGSFDCTRGWRSRSAERPAGLREESYGLNRDAQSPRLQMMPPLPSSRLT
jgi:hypothetical protein